jgi:hypothetical protein
MSAWGWLGVGVGAGLLIALLVWRIALLLAARRRKKSWRAPDDGFFSGNIDIDASWRMPRLQLPPLPSADENVQFTVYRPREVAPDCWYPLVAFAHLAAKPAGAPPHEPEPVKEVERQARAVLGERLAQDYRPVTQDAPQAVPREATLTFVPDVPGVEFNPPSRNFRWTESVHREEFRLRAGAGLAGQTARGRLSVFLGDILLADVLLAIPVNRSAAPPTPGGAHEVEQSRPYRKIFASYSHRDAHIVEQFEHLARALGDVYLRDWQHLRAGEVWNDRLRAMIEEADVFQLFWSRNAMESAYVRQEWEHALSLNRPHFVRPTYWEEPLPGDPARKLPPEELLRLHFQRIGPLLRAITESEATRHVRFRARPLPGLGIAGYEILHPLGRGGMATTYVARHTPTWRRVVIKLRPAVAGTNPPPKTEIIRLNHPGIVDILDAGEADGQSYQVEPYVAGHSLAERLRERPLPSVDDVARLGLALAQATDHAHRRHVYHFNLKPRKVLLDAVGLPHLTGFHCFPPPEEGVIFGTPAYMAPEQATGRAGEMGPATDVYGLGAILYECLTGSPPVQGATVMETLQRVRSGIAPPLRQLRPDLPSEFAAIVLRCLETRSADRYASAEDLVIALSRFLAVEREAIVRSSPPPQWRFPARQKRTRLDKKGAGSAYPQPRGRKPKGCLAVAILLVISLAILAAAAWLRSR